MICGNIVQIKPIIHEKRSRLLIMHRTTLLYALGAQNIGGIQHWWWIFLSCQNTKRVIARISSFGPNTDDTHLRVHGKSL